MGTRSTFALAPDAKGVHVTVLQADYHQFMLSEGEWGDEPEQKTQERVCLIFEPRVSRVSVLTGIDTGLVHVEAMALDLPPAGVADGWQDVAEVSLHVADGPLVASGWGDDGQASDRLDGFGPGTYRIRIHANGRDVAQARSSLGPDETFMLIAWPAPHAPPVQLRATSSTARTETLTQ